jgi:hypothetical protein
LLKIQGSADFGHLWENNAVKSALSHEHAFKQDRANDLKSDK